MKPYLLLVLALLAGCSVDRQPVGDYGVGYDLTPSFCVHYPDFSLCYLGFCNCVEAARGAIIDAPFKGSWKFGVVNYDSIELLYPLKVRSKFSPSRHVPLEFQFEGRKSYIMVDLVGCPGLLTCDAPHRVRMWDKIPSGYQPNLFDTARDLKVGNKCEERCN